MCFYLPDSELQLAFFSGKVDHGHNSLIGDRFLSVDTSCSHRWTTIDRGTVGHQQHPIPVPICILKWEKCQSGAASATATCSSPTAHWSLCKAAMASSILDQYLVSFLSLGRKIMDSEAVYSVRVGSCITNLHLETLKEEEEEEEEEPVLSFFHSLPQWNFFSSSFFSSSSCLLIWSKSRIVFSLLLLSVNLFSLSPRTSFGWWPPLAHRRLLDWITNKLKRIKRKWRWGGCTFVLFCFF